VAWAAGDALALRFDSRVLYNLGNLLSNYLKSKLNNMLVDAGGSLVLGAAYATLALPQKLIRSFFLWLFFFSYIGVPLFLYILDFVRVVFLYPSAQFSGSMELS